MTDRALEYQRDWQREFRKTAEGRMHIRRMNLKKYGLTPEQYDTMHQDQNGLCAVCGNPETASNQYGPLKLAVDHCHNSNVVRGLLCMRCNRSLGMLRDDPEIIESLLAYRRKHP
jgi:hypothetical protein